MDWVSWHCEYDRDPSLRRRLEVVQGQIARQLDCSTKDTVQVISLCAGQGRDLLPVIAAHPRRSSIRGRLVEREPRNVEIAAASVEEAGLTSVEVIRGDASLVASFEGAVPADVILACGVFGNISDHDIARTIEHLPMLCAEGASVVWTRGRTDPDLRPTIRSWFAEHGFEELFFEGEPESFGVGVHRLTTAPRPFDPTLTLFTFRD